MGNQTSSTFINNETKPASVDDLVRPNKFISPSKVEEMRNNIQSVLDFHTKLNGVYKKVKATFSTLTIQIGKESVIEKILKLTYTNANVNLKNTNVLKALDEDKAMIQLLFNLGIFKTHIVNNETFKVIEHMNFNVVHTQFIKNLNILLKINPVVAQFSANTVNENSIKKQFDNNLETMNNITARIMYYKYCIVFNNYLMHIYSIYAQSQFELFKASAKKNKKQDEFSLVQKELDIILKETTPKYSVSLSNSLNNLNQTTKVSGGSNTSGLSASKNNIVSSVQKVKDLLKKNWDEFNQSNESTAKFFAIVNKVLDEKTKQVIMELETSKNTTIINDNINKALKALEKQINDNTITPTSENIESMISQLTNDDKEKAEIRNHLKLVSIKANAVRLNTGLNATGEMIDRSTQMSETAQREFYNASNTLTNNSNGAKPTNGAANVANPTNGAANVANVAKPATVANPTNGVATVANPTNGGATGYTPTNKGINYKHTVKNTMKTLG
jgi:hypothetical protein